MVYVMLSLISGMSPPHALCNLSVRTVVKLYTLVFFCVRNERGFMNCDDMCMCVVSKQFDPLEFVFDCVYADQQYDEIYLTF